MHRSPSTRPPFSTSAGLWIGGIAFVLVVVGDVPLGRGARAPDRLSGASEQGRPHEESAGETEIIAAWHLSLRSASPSCKSTRTTSVRASFARSSRPGRGIRPARSTWPTCSRRCTFTSMRHDPKRPEWPERDRLLLSCGHIAPVRYSAMAYAGYFPVEELLTLRKFGTRLQGHPERVSLPALETTSGPLGEGLAQGTGMALGAKLDHADWRVYVDHVRRRAPVRAALGSDDDRREVQARQPHVHHRPQLHPDRRQHRGHHAARAARRQIPRVQLGSARVRRQRHGRAASTRSTKRRP